MKPVKDGSVAASPRPVRGVWGRVSLRREIVIVLLIKLALIMAIKMVFFSHPLSTQETQAHLDAVLAGHSAQTSAGLPTHSTDQTEQP